MLAAGVLAIGGTTSAVDAHDTEFEGFAWVPSRTLTVGSNRHYPEEAPAHPVKVDGFWIDVTPVTNRQFAAFVKATGHVTIAEKLQRRRLSRRESQDAARRFTRIHSAESRRRPPTPRANCLTNGGSRRRPVLPRLPSAPSRDG